MFPAHRPALQRQRQRRQRHASDTRRLESLAESDVLLADIGLGRALFRHQDLTIASSCSDCAAANQNASPTSANASTTPIVCPSSTSVGASGGQTSGSVP